MTTAPRSPEETGEDRSGDPVAALLHRELRAAGSDAREAGATTEEVTADLTERIDRLRRRAAGA
jgi:hypothetical protein